MDEPEPDAVAGAGVDGEDGGEDVLGVVAVPPPAEDSSGKVELVLPPAWVEGPDPPPVKTLPMNMPKTVAAAAATTSCQVRQDLCSLIPSWPGAEIPDLDSVVDHPSPVALAGEKAGGGGGERGATGGGAGGARGGMRDVDSVVDHPPPVPLAGVKPGGGGGGGGERGATGGGAGGARGG
ncbi:MAG: hypothetical protein P4L20_17015, partial [Acidimicrobiales bacterium]|nr:hypothetical protein [Acidimicrobiales bacterium]